MNSALCLDKKLLLPPKGTELPISQSCLLFLFRPFKNAFSFRIEGRKYPIEAIEE